MTERQPIQLNDKEKTFLEGASFDVTQLTAQKKCSPKDYRRCSAIVVQEAGAITFSCANTDCPSEPNGCGLDHAVTLVEGLLKTRDPKRKF